MGKLFKSVQILVFSMLFLGSPAFACISAEDAAQVGWKILLSSPYSVHLISYEETFDFDYEFNDNDHLHIFRGLGMTNGCRPDRCLGKPMDIEVVISCSGQLVEVTFDEHDDPI